MLARRSIKRLFYFDKYLLKANQIYNLSTNKVENNKLFLTDQYSSFTFGDLNILSSKLSSQLLSSLNSNDLNGEKIAVLCSNNYTYLVSLLAIWKANGVPLGLNKTYPINLIEYFLNDSKCKLAINGISPDEAKNSNQALDTLLSNQNVSNFKLVENEFFRNKETNINDQNNALESLTRLLDLPENSSKEGLILYTSGTSGPPKGVILTRKNMQRTIETLKTVWEWSPNDNLLHVLPLNHVHGLTYGLLTSFYSGAQCDMLAKFNADLVWSKLLDESNNINVFMAVPTIFVNLVNTYLSSEQLQKKYDKNHINHIFKTKIRLVASGSAPLNVKTYNEWNQITGYSILERYGMTEIGLGLSNVYKETDTLKREAGAVGRPYGETIVRIVEPNDSNDDSKHVVVESYKNNDKILADDKPLVGELQIKGDMVFREYHGKPVQTKETFTEDGWFKTGDTAEFLKDLKIYKLLGRTSVDVIKSGGYKISALDIEKEILAHPQIDDVSILGLSDPKWGQKIFALIVLKQNSISSFSTENFIKWCKTRLPKYSVPKLVKIINKMPRNQLGKVNKKELIKKYEKENC